MRTYRWAACALGVAAALTVAPPAAAADECRRAVVFTLPGITWQDVHRVRPPALLRAVDAGAAASVSVRTIFARTSYASGFVTLGAGARVDGGQLAGGPAGAPPPVETGRLARGVPVGGLRDVRAGAESAGYGARVGGLAAAMGELPLVAIGNSDPGRPAPMPAGFGRYALLAAMDRSGLVGYAATNESLLERASGWPFGVRTDPDALETAIDAALGLGCSSLVIDQGDLIRADRYAAGSVRGRSAVRDRALLAADRTLGFVQSRLDFERDLLMLVSPTSPAWPVDTQLGVAVVVGPGYEAGASMQSSSTRRRGLVTLPDVAPTILAHLGINRPSAMNGGPWVPVPPPPSGRIASAIELNAESVFIDGVKNEVSAGYVVFQIVVYLLALALLFWRERRGHRAADGLGVVLEAGGLAIVAFPIATFLAGFVAANALGAGPYVALILGIDAALVSACWAAARRSLDRLMLLAGFTLAVLCLDLVTGARLQINTVFGYSPIVAGRFAGAGNTAFSILAATTVVCGSLLVHRRGATRQTLTLVGLLFAVVVIVDGAPQWGSDVGGILALVPGFGITWALLAGYRPSVRMVMYALAAMLGAFGLFLAVDFLRPEESRTHLARLFEDVFERGGGVFYDTLKRKAAANIRVFRTSIYTFFIPPGLGAIAWLILRPKGRWEVLAGNYPKGRAGIIGGLLVAVLGFAVNDSGIAIPAVMLSFLVPMALILHLVIERGVRE